MDDVFLGDDFPDGYITDTHIIIPGLEPMPFDHDEWIEWAGRQLVHRARVAKDCARSAQARAIHRALCLQPWGLGKIYFDITFNWIYEPREDDDLAMVPMVLYPRQAMLIFTLDAVDRQPKGQFSSLAIEKARGVGATWICSSFDLHDWLFRKGFQGRFVSRNEDLVDGVGDSDSYFWKLDYQMDRLPAWMVPAGYSTQRGTWRTHMKMVNPVNGSTIKGEATTSGIGVGGRARRYTIDEAARIRNFASIWGQLSETTNHRIAISTHNIEVSSDFWDMCKGLNGWDSPVIFSMPWDCVPGRDEHWLAETKMTMKDDIFQREVMMNPHAGISTWVYPQARLMVPGRHSWKPGGGLGFTGMDDGYDDDFAIGWFQWDRGGNHLTILDGYQNSHKPLAFYGTLLRGILDGKYAWDQEAQRLAQWITRFQLWQNTHVGDRHGDNTDLTSGISPWMKLQLEYGITVQPSSSLYNEEKIRRDALSETLLTARVGDTPGAWAILEALQQNKFPAPKPDSNFSAEHRKPIHDQTSHYATMCQYVAMYVMEHFQPKSFFGMTRDNQVSGSSNNGWLAKQADPFGRKYSRNLRADQEASNGWIR